MSRTGWHLVEEGGTLTLSRRWPPRFDVSAETRFPPLRRRRLLHQVRQDLWRRLRHVRGFSPVLRAAPDDDGLTLTAGGRLDAGGDDTRKIAAELSDFLATPDLRARWIRHAGPRA